MKTKKQRAKELKDGLLEMIQRCRRECRELTDDEQKLFDEQKNELLALAEEIKGVEDKLDAVENELPDVEEKADEEETPEPQETAPEEQPAEQPANEEQPDEEPASEPEKPEEKPEEKSDEDEPGNAPEGDQINKDETSPEETPEETPKDDEEKEQKSKASINIMSKKNFSLVGAIRAAAEGRQFDDFTAAVIEEGRKQLRANGQHSSAQIILPTESRTITVTDNHDSIIETEFTDILDILQASPVMQKARALTGLVGDVQVPQILAGTAGEGNVGASWLGENAENTLSQFKFDHRKLSPKRLSTTLILSKSLIMQDSIGVENAVRKALIDSVKQKLETTFLSADAGTTTKPVGIFNGKEATVVDNFKKLCAFEAVAERANYNRNLEYLLSPEAKAEIRSWNYGGGRTGRMVLEGQEIDGTPFISTSNVEANKFAYINWEDILVGTWQGLELEVANDLALQRTNSIALTLSGFFDWMVLRPEAVQLATVAAGTIDGSTGL